MWRSEQGAGLLKFWLLEKFGHGASAHWVDGSFLIASKENDGLDA